MDKPFQDFIDQQLGACGFVLLDNAMIKRQRPLFFSHYFGRRVAESKRYYREAAALLAPHAQPVLLTLEGGRIVPCLALSLDKLSERISQLLGVSISAAQGVSLQELLSAIDNPEAFAEPEPPARQADYWQRREQEIAEEGQRRDAELDAELAEFGSSRLYDDEPSPSAFDHMKRY